MDQEHTPLRERMMQPDPSPTSSPVSPFLVESFSVEEDDVFTDQGLSFPATDEAIKEEECSPLYRRSTNSGDPELTAWQRHNMLVSSQTWIKVLSILTTALFIDVIILSVYLYKGPYVGQPQIVHEPVVVVDSPGGWQQLPSSETVMTSLVFGSSSSQNRPQTYWDTLSMFNPDLVILAGDNVYGACTDSNCSELRTAYEELSLHPSFVGAKATLPVVATLDDNDYGYKDANKNNPYKDEAKQLFLDFFHITDERRDRVGEGVYKSYEWGPDGQRVQLILLDTRYSRSPFLPTDMYNLPGKERYRPDYGDTKKKMLSEEQWKFLESQLVRPTNVRLVVSSLQVLAEGTGFECWRMLPHERNRLLAALKDNQPGTATAILSGDRLVGGFYQHDGLTEVTSSSWTHTIPNDICNNSPVCDEVDPHRVGDLVHENNFGSVEIDWEKRIMTLAIRRVEPSSRSKSPHTSPDQGQVIQSLEFPIP